MTDDYTDPDAIMSSPVNTQRALESLAFGEPRTPAPTPRGGQAGAEVSAMITGMRRTVSTWRWPSDVLEAIADDDDPEDSARRLRRLREAARDNVLEGLALARRTLNAGNVEGARSVVDRASARWGRWIRQSEEIRQRVLAEDPSWFDAVINMADDLPDALELANAAEDAIDTAASVGQSALVLAGLVGLAVLGASLSRR
jgi:hypothetical protein